MNLNEDLIHAINGTDLLPVLVPQVDEKNPWRRR